MPKSLAIFIQCKAAKDRGSRHPEKIHKFSSSVSDLDLHSRDCAVEAWLCSNRNRTPKEFDDVQVHQYVTRRYFRAFLDIASARNMKEYMITGMDPCVDYLDDYSYTGEEDRFVKFKARKLQERIFKHAM